MTRMKKIPYLLILVLCSFVCLTSCEDEPLEGVFFSTGDGSDPTTENSQNIDSEITAVIDGEDFEASGEEVTGVLNMGFFSLSATTGEQTMVITISEVEGEGTFDLSVDGTGIGALSIQDSNSISNVTGGSGSITIETLDISNAVASGIFEFIAIDPITGEAIEVTNGTFTVPLIL